MDFVIGLPISTDWKKDSYDSILVIVDRLTKMVHYKPVKVTIDTLGLAEVIINVVVRHHGLPDLIVTDQGLLSPRNSSHCYAISQASSKDSTPLSTPIRTGWPKGKIVQWKPIFEHLSTSSRMIRPDSYRWLSLLTITPRMLAPASRLSSSTADTILGFYIKKTSISAHSQELWKNYSLSSKSWWPFASRTSTTYKSFKSEPTIKILSHKATLQATRYGWVVSNSKLSRIASWKPSFSVLFEYYTRYANKLTSSICPRNGEFTTSFTYPYWNRIPQKKSE